jgi:hypothetical protein
LVGSLLVLALVQENIPKIIMRLGIIGTNPEGFLILVSGLLVLALLQENVPKVIMCLRIIGIDPEGFLILVSGLLVLALVQENIPKVVICLGKIGINPEGFLILVSGLLVLALVQENIPKIIMGSVLVRGLLHTICPKFQLTIPNSVPPIGSSHKKKDQQTIDDNFYDMRFRSCYQALHRCATRPIS